MARKRKTIEVERIRQLVNTMLATSISRHGSTPDKREAVAGLLEIVLIETGNYKGFRCLHLDEVPAGEAAGIFWTTDRADVPTAVWPDDSRRYYN